MDIRRIYVEKKQGFDIEAQGMLADFKENLGVTALAGVRVLRRYDVDGLSSAQYEQVKALVFAEPQADDFYDEHVEIAPDERAFAIEYLPGQYDQRADSALQCIQIITKGGRVNVRTATLLLLKGDISDQDFDRVKRYCINPVEAQEAGLDKPSSLSVQTSVPDNITHIKGFTGMDDSALRALRDRLGLAMDIDDLRLCRDYFLSEKRDISMTELRVLDTYWSDHCRHTTFLTEITHAEFEPGADVIEQTYHAYLSARDKAKPVCLMDVATSAMRILKKQGVLDNLDESEEINACSIEVEIEVDGAREPWLIMFKNETHNHPTEIEPFGGAATCLGGAIRDPLSGRSYVYQAMRVTGCGDPTLPVSAALPGKLPQRKITTAAAAGYSSYGNQIGLATGQVAEIYHPGYVAKRMEIGAVVGAAPKKNVRRARPEAGDAVILLGGRTGRDGCGGATGSSKAHNNESLENCGAEVQKGNAPVERKLQRLFRNAEAATMIKRCNDFGAGGISVAVGELARGLDIRLDLVPRKYEGLDGTELAISESQERMAIVVAQGDAARFIELAHAENLEATRVAEVTDTDRLRMLWRSETIVDIARPFLDSNGAPKKTRVRVAAPHKYRPEAFNGDMRARWVQNISGLNTCSQKGLVDMFDSTIGANTLLMPFGGLYQNTPAQGMAAKLPVLKGVTNACTLMTYGYNPSLSSCSPFHGAIIAVIESVAKIAAMGGDYKNIRLTLQEYFERLKDETRWGKPFAALLGAYRAQMELGLAAIGGKDSMSGSFNELDVPPTLVSFALAPADARDVISPEFKAAHNTVALIPLAYTDDELPDFPMLKGNLEYIHTRIKSGEILSAAAIRTGGAARALCEMCFGNKIGVHLDTRQDLFEENYGGFVVELAQRDALAGIEHTILGRTIPEGRIIHNDISIELDELLRAWEGTLEKVFPTQAHCAAPPPPLCTYNRKNTRAAMQSFAKPRVFIPAFPGTNCEYDSARAFDEAGAVSDVFVFRNLNRADIEYSLAEMVRRIEACQIIMLPGGFSAGDEPDGSGKFIAAVFRSPNVRAAVMDLLKRRGGLMLGICNGFQALIKLGLVPYGEIRDMTADCPTLTFNTLSRHISKFARTRIASNLSPWLYGSAPGDICAVPLSHGEGRFAASASTLAALAQNGQIATQYVDASGIPTMDIQYNPNGSSYAVEGITSPDGRVFGKMGHSERITEHVAKNIPLDKWQTIFKSGVAYYG